MVVRGTITKIPIGAIRTIIRTIRVIGMATTTIGVVTTIRELEQWQSKKSRARLSKAPNVPTTKQFTSFSSQGPSSSNNEMRRIEMMFEQMMKKNLDSDTQLASHNTSIRNLEVQLGQISQSLNTRPKGALPSDTVVNPNGGNNHVMEVTTRSGRGDDMNTSKQKAILSDDVELQEDEIPLVVENVVDENMNEEVRIDIQDVKVETQNDSLSINMPLVKAIEQMLGYAKFMKDLVTKKRSMDCETIKMTHQVSAIVHSMAPKLEDPSAFIIPCTIGSADFSKALCDLGASINLMPYSVFKTLGIRQPRPTSMRLQMADRTMKRPLDIIDDVLVQVDKFILPVDFVILNCEIDYEVPIILGRPFLATGKALVDSNSSEVCSFVDLITMVIFDGTSAMINVEDPLEAVLLNLDVNDDEGRVDCVNALHGMGSYSYEPRKLSLDLENRKTPPTKPSIEEPPVLELKSLPPHLRFMPHRRCFKSGKRQLDGL
ncbi:uncharacterized protein [Nicotiana sylvestris]|uniref:uncharacterized protein n=1 Tax=Nicotiana sylvestris TaxID=4096 RepID=UPI00388C57DF